MKSVNSSVGHFSLWRKHNRCFSMCLFEGSSGKHNRSECNAQWHSWQIFLTESLPDWIENRTHSSLIEHRNNKRIAIKPTDNSYRNSFFATNSNEYYHKFYRVLSQNSHKNHSSTVFTIYFVANTSNFFRESSWEYLT